jgi:hypothetical protein
MEESFTVAEIRISILQFFALSYEEQCTYLPTDMETHHLESYWGEFRTNCPIRVMEIRLEDYISFDIDFGFFEQFIEELRDLQQYIEDFCYENPKTKNLVNEKNWWLGETFQSLEEWQTVREMSRALLLKMGFELDYPKIPFNEFLYGY